MIHHITILTLVLIILLLSIFLTIKLNNKSNSEYYSDNFQTFDDCWYLRETTEWPSCMYKLN
jgi:hypothetical protein